MTWAEDDIERGIILRKTQCGSILTNKLLAKELERTERQRPEITRRRDTRTRDR